MAKKSRSTSSPAGSKRRYPFGLKTVMELFDVGPFIAISALSIAFVIILIAIAYFVRSAPPGEISISTGPDGSVFHKNALKYAKVLEKHGVKLKVLTSKGSLENLPKSFAVLPLNFDRIVS